MPAALYIDSKCMNSHIRLRIFFVLLVAELIGF